MEGGVVKLIANTLSTVTILSCMFLKVPQIMTIRKRKSAEGIVVPALMMEATAFTVMCLYNYTNDYSLMTYLEYPIILMQVFVLIHYVVKYKKLVPQRVIPLCVATYGLIVVGFMLGCLPQVILSYLVPLCAPVSGFAKVMYIYGIIVEENADGVSLTTWIISMATNLARVFTVYVDSGDLSLIVNFLIATFLSGGVLLSAMYYQNRNGCAAEDCAVARRRRRKQSTRHAD